MSAQAATHAAIEAVWRIECAKIVATVARLTHDIGLAEECAQDALVSALEHWPARGLPDNPAAWLVATAKNRALDQLRHHALRDRRLEELGLDLQAQEALVVPDFVDALDAARQDTIGDDLLRLIFTACHPILPTDARVALTLRLLGGLSTAEIARAFLLPEATIAQRIVRAKKTLATAQVPYELPAGNALTERLASVLEVLYLIFNEGYAATSGGDWMRLDLCDEALRLARVLAGLAPHEPEVHGLQALMEIQASRAKSRVDAQGRPVLLADQDRSRWDALLIRRGLAALARAESLGDGRGVYTLQAALAACHARAQSAAATDWPRIVGLYDQLLQVAPSPVVALNRAVAVGMAFGPAAGLACVDELSGEPLLASYPWLPSVRGDLLAKLGRGAEAKAQFETAAALTGNQRERELLLERAEAVG
ncbi:MAG TPA: RNA polymerase sigma factor [Rubrivivax sp.]|nr:RNA polymerase sigma factor [Rubrivivax sp.]